MYFDDVKKVFAAIGVQVEIDRNDGGAWAGYHYRWNAYDHGWEHSRVSDVSETQREAIGKLTLMVCSIITDNKSLLKAIKETGYQHNGFVFNNH